MISAAEALNGNSQPAELFFILSGEHPTLPAAEVLSILDASGITHANPTYRYRLLRINAPSAALNTVYERSLMFDQCGVILGECGADLLEITKLIRNLPIERITRGGESFAVRSVRVGGGSRNIRRVDAEKYVGSLIKEAVPGSKVDLESPDLTFLCILHAEGFILGLSKFLKPSGHIHARRPRRRPVFHPATMPPKIARCMVNLARSTPGRIFCDPFCGVGGILIEATLLGCQAVGVDLSARMVRSSRRNLSHFRLNSLGLIRGDSRKLAVRNIAAIATDPPYGRDSSTMGSKVQFLFEAFLANAGELMAEGAYLCISAPSHLAITDYAQDAGFAFKEKHLVRIHRSLTRQVVVLRNQ